MRSASERGDRVYEITSQEEDNMNILVCVKQVPDTTQIKIDPVKHTLIREVLSTAMRLRQQPALRTKIPIPRS